MYIVETMNTAAELVMNIHAVFDLDSFAKRMGLSSEDAQLLLKDNPAIWDNIPIPRTVHAKVAGHCYSVHREHTRGKVTELHGQVVMTSMNQHNCFLTPGHDYVYMQHGTNFYKRKILGLYDGYLIISSVIEYPSTTICVTEEYYLHMMHRDECRIDIIPELACISIMHAGFPDVRPAIVELVSFIKVSRAAFSMIDGVYSIIVQTILTDDEVKCLETIIEQRYLIEEVPVSVSAVLIELDITAKVHRIAC